MIKIEIKNIPNLDLDHDLNLACKKRLDWTFAIVSYRPLSMSSIVHKTKAGTGKKTILQIELAKISKTMRYTW